MPLGGSAASLVLTNAPVALLEPGGPNSQASDSFWRVRVARDRDDFVAV